MAVLLYILSTNSIVTTWIHEEAINEVLSFLIHILHAVIFFSVDLATKGRGGRLGWLDWLTLPQSIQFDQISSLLFIHELMSFQSI